jgi:hypothetical protein
LRSNTAKKGKKKRKEKREQERKKSKAGKNLVPVHHLGAKIGSIKSCVCANYQGERVRLVRGRGGQRV